MEFECTRPITPCSHFQSGPVNFVVGTEYFIHMTHEFTLIFFVEKNVLSHSSSWLHIYIPKNTPKHSKHYKDLNLVKLGMYDVNIPVFRVG